MNMDNEDWDQNVDNSAVNDGDSSDGSYDSNGEQDSF